MKTYEHNFKLLAIRPLKGCDSKYTRTLVAGTLYPLFQNCVFKTDDYGNVTEIKSDNSSEQLYNQRFDNAGKLAINISAVVGENGSGKSSLMELFYISLYLIGLQGELITLADSDLYSKSISDEIETIKDKLKVEIYCEIDHSYYCYRVDGNSTLDYHTENVKVINVLSGNETISKDLFFSLVINYSLYGLNMESSGRWLWKIFNKNDGYRTPIIINPYRTWGNINIISEAHLAQSRLLANIKPNANGDIGFILSDKKIESVKLTLKVERLRKLDGLQLESVLKTLESTLEISQEEIFNRIYQEILDTKNLPNHFNEVTFGTYLQQYVLKKVIKIARNYKEYRDKFYVEFPGKNRMSNTPSLRDLDGFLKVLKQDRSHVTLKLRQALNSYKFNLLRINPEEKMSRYRFLVEFSIGTLLDRVKKAHGKSPDRELVEFIPLAMFMPNIILSDGSNFMALSSGEQQFIHSMQSVIYHLSNLNSVYQVTLEKERYIRKKFTYQHVNIVLDEIELYFHPEYQRRYLYELLFNLRSLEIPNIKAINIVFLTHSPFILSDIPASNILKLRGGRIEQQTIKTFAGNIHTMLSDSFFMKSTIGEFARNEYARIIDFYNKVREAKEEEFAELQLEYRNKKEIFSYIVDIIGEDVLQRVLMNNISYIEKKLALVDESTFIERLLQDRKRIDEDLKKLGYDKD